MPSHRVHATADPAVAPRPGAVSGGAARWSHLLAALLLHGPLLLGPLLLSLAGCRPGLAAQVDPTAALDVDWGIYRIYWSSRDYGADMEALRARHPRPPSYVMFYRDLDNLTFPERAVEGIRGLGAAPVISLELWLWHDSKTPYLPLLVEGRFDDELKAWARAARDEGGPVLLRFGFEMNGDWFSWNGDPELYVQAWRHAHQLFEEVGAHNVQWLWTPNVTDVPPVPDNDAPLYYPGDDVVDWVGLDGYNFGEHHDEYHVWQSFADVFDEPLAELSRLYPDKPVFIGETGCAPGEPGAKAAWIRDAWATLARYPSVKAVLWFDLDKRREGEPDWRLASEADALAAFNETFAATRNASPGQ